jgi:hypothetical protein
MLRRLELEAESGNDNDGLTVLADVCSMRGLRALHGSLYRWLED